ncbi:ABC transporter permease [Pseudobacteroides cellulosolvens]|uniref:MacB-like periplasmic core domain containing protein n=1 Tax=Pseudobacteroides cellulosolvens ATCC 35603 = DSM 2933 TaxID=398512 RepID=A0A0L6JXN5_9FIRM|nr:FtsX-like permease family protein [Pseudobacteroides cellulosolvens]KNY30330.1 MacB-like periplasmic core domain containing protein [Pseudobacteroides cellulosolvens ATCC 35603 = DSM 2933]
MNNIDLLKTGLKNLKRRKARTFLTVLGVLIGTTSIVIMISFGIGIKHSINNQMLSIGSLRVIDVNNYGFFPEMGGQKTVTKKEKLNDALIRRIAEWEGVEAVTPLLEANLKCVAGKYMSQLMVLGINPDVLEKFEFSAQEGRLLTKTDDLSLLVGSMVPMNFYNPKRMNSYQGMMMMGGPNAKPPVDLMNEKLVLTFDFSYGEKVPKDPMGAQPTENKKPPKLYKAKAVGIIKQSNNEKDYNVYMNLESVRKLIKENAKGQQNSGMMMGMGGMSVNPNEYQRAQILVKDIKYIDDIQNRLKEMGLGANSVMDMAKEMEKAANMIQMILGALGAISLFVAAIGIGNTMVMSVYERTREIGIMKVLGATFGDIRKLFLLEAALIGFFGGMVGIGLSYGTSSIINTVINSMSQGNPEMGGEALV